MVEEKEQKAAVVKLRPGSTKECWRVAWFFVTAAFEILWNGYVELIFPLPPEKEKK